MGNIYNKPEQRKYRGPRTSSASLFAFFSCVLPYVLLACCLLTYPARKASGSEQHAQRKWRAADATETLHNTDTPNVPIVSGNDFKQRLWQTRIGIADTEKKRENNEELKRIIEQVRSIEFKPERESPEPAVSVAPLPSKEPNETTSATETSGDPAEKKTVPEPGYEPISDQTLQMLRNLLQHPEQLENAFELGEVLFLSTNAKEAAEFYQLAISHEDPNNAWSARNKDWILFQIGNCLRHEDQTAARKIYRQLITEHPNSPWTNLAKAQEKLIEWYLVDKPGMLIRGNIAEVAQTNSSKETSP